MKFAHWAAVVVLVLLSLMNLGTVAGGTSTTVMTIGIVFGLAGLIAIYGLVRRTSWGPLAALAIGAANLVTSVIGLVVGWEGSPIGIGVSTLALLLTAVGESATLRRKGVAEAR
jgi:hypothetical protein